MAYDRAMEQQASHDITAPVHELGQYTAWTRRDALHRPIDIVWTSVAPALNPKSHWMLPHGEPSIAIRRKRNRRGEIIAADLTVCGPFSHSAIYTPSPTEELIGVRLKPEISAAVFGIVPADHMNQAPEPAPRQLEAACERSLAVAETAPIQQIISLLSDDLLCFSRDKLNATTPECHAAELLRRTNGSLRCSQIAALLNVSERHLRRRFRDHLGFSPKTYASQLRLTAAVLAAEKSARPDWADIALSRGFHDQSHMINTFQLHLGVSPQTIHKARRALSSASGQPSDMSGFCKTA